jgi:hypothetical protein
LLTAISAAATFSFRCATLDEEVRGVRTNESGDQPLHGILGTSENSCVATAGIRVREIDPLW